MRLISSLILLNMITAVPVIAQSTLLVPQQYATIQSAIDAAVSNDTILVSSGVYQENLNIKRKTINLRGAGAKQTTIDGSRALGATIFIQTGFMTGGLIEGFTITGGNHPAGGGIFMSGGSPTISRCTIRGNTCTSYGAGIGGTGESPRIEYCEIFDNHATGLQYSSGGGIGLGTSGGSSATNPGLVITHCLIRDNTASSRGGGIYLTGTSHPLIENCQLTRNQTLGRSAGLTGGGAVFLAIGAVGTVWNSRIWHNTSLTDGGGVKFFNVTGVQIINNTIINNTGGSVAGIANGGSSGINVSADVVNCILFGNGKPELSVSGKDQNGLPPTVNVSYSNVEGGYTGAGNINAAPNLLQIASGNHHLTASSACIDAGTDQGVTLPSLDMDGDTRKVGKIDIGADEYSAAAVLHWSDHATVSAGAPTDVIYSVDGGSQNSGLVFVVLFSMSGTTPGEDHLGMHLPLNFDSLTPLVSTVTGVLDLSGKGSSPFPFARLSIPQAMIGLGMSSAAVVLDAAPSVRAFSNSERIEFVK